MPISPEDATRFARTFAALVDGIAVALLGKESTIRLALTTMLSDGHLLLEDAPGTGKTALARAMAAVIDGTQSRIQFTPDLLPSDITGVSIYDQKTGDWVFQAGPVFAQVVLADEVNRASPKTQSALLEVMEESQVTVGGVTHPAPRPFIVIATQNPIEQAGTYRLPEAQLDRFLMKTSIGYPARAAMIDVLEGAAAPNRSRLVRPVVTAEQLTALSALSATELVPERIRLSCPPPRPMGDGLTPLRTSRAPMPTGPPILCAERLMRSTPESPKLSGMCPKAWTASLWLHAPTRRACSTTWLRGCVTPVSLLTTITETTATC